MAKATEHEGEPRHERLEELVRIEGKVSEAAEAAADAAAHAVEATKAAERASVARAAKKARAADTAKAAKAAATAKDRAGTSAEAAEAASAETAFNAPPPSEPTGSREDPMHVLELRLADDELEQLAQLAAKEDVLVPDLARSLLVRAIGHSDDDD